MRKILCRLTVVCWSMWCAAALAAETDVDGSLDHPVIAERFEGSYILGYAHSSFERLVLPLGRGEVDPNTGMDVFVKSQPVEGELTRIVYVAEPTATPLEVFRNYQMALEKAGFETLFACSRDDCGGRFNRVVCPVSRVLTNRPNLTEFACYSLTNDHHFVAAERQTPEGTVWASVYVVKNELPSEPRLNLHPVALVEIVEQATVANKMQLVRADEMSRAIGKDGKVALYGIYFDTDKAVVRPDSEPTLAEIAKLLEESPALKVYVVGHTDNVGAFAHNLDLSQRRAKAVVAGLLEAHGIGADRLAPHGVGSLAPAATNATEEGRAKNRRVEIVAQ